MLRLTLEERCVGPAGQRALAGELTEGQFQEEDGHSHKHQHNNVGNEEGA